MATQKAVVITAPKEAKVLSHVPIPECPPTFIRVKVHSVALNPTDWKHIDFLADPGAIVGCDYSGWVEEVGSKVTKDFKKGDRVCGFTHGSNAVNHSTGAFAEHILAKGDVAIKIPDTLSFEEAATLGVGITTVGQALYQSLKLPLPTEPAKEPLPILIYGGSTATGSLAIQFAKLSGLTVITTCSPRNFELVKKYGADAAFDYNDPETPKKIRELTNNSLKYALDTISEGKSAQICADSLSTAGGVYTQLLNVKSPREDVESKGTLGYTSFGEDFKMGPQGNLIPAKPEDFEFAKMFWELSRKLLAEGKIKVHPPTVGKGLEGVLDGLQKMREGKVSGTKLVYTISESF